jgi:hypothetical protein
MLRKKEVFTTITPIPGFIPRQLAIDILHSHSEVITLNPLVLEHKPIKAPRDAASDEFYSTWYEIIERIQYIPGMGKMGSGKISFNGCFHDMPWGLQTHIYAPMNIDLRNKYRIDGNQPGYEAPVQPEIGLAGLGAPADGLYLREDIEIKCNIAVMSFVKAQLKAASKEMVSRIIKKAELLDAGVLQAMIEDGKLKTINPADRSNTMKSPGPSPTGSFATPQMQQQQPMSPRMPYQVPRPQSVQPGQYGARPSTAGSQQYAPQYNGPTELPGTTVSHLPPAGQTVVMELPGDYYHPQSSPHSSHQLTPHQPSPGLAHPHPSPALSQHSAPDRDSQATTGDWRWSQSQQSVNNSRPTSMASQPGSAGYASPSLDHKGFAQELPTHSETQEEHHMEPLNTKSSGTFKLDPAPRTQQQYTYNPRDYANVGR